MMNADTAMNLVMQPNFAVGNVIVAVQLDPVHSHVRILEAGVVGVFRIDLRQRDERSAVSRPALQLR